MILTRHKLEQRKQKRGKRKKLLGFSFTMVLVKPCQLSRDLICELMFHLGERACEVNCDPRIPFPEGKGGADGESIIYAQCHTASLKEYLKHSCFLSNYKNCIWGTSTHTVFSEAPFSTYHLSGTFKTSNFLSPPLFGPCIPGTWVWIDSGLPLGSNFHACYEQTPHLYRQSHSPHLLHFPLGFFILNKIDQQRGKDKSKRLKRWK